MKGNQFDVLSDSSTIDQIKQAITFIAKRENWGNYGLLIDVLNCESGLKNSARGKAGEIGIGQFKPTTWKWLNEIRGTDLDIYSIKDQISMFVWSMKNGYESHWTCVKLLNF